MKRISSILAVILTYLTVSGATIPERFTIIELNTPTLTVGNKELKIGDSFSSDATIYWKSKNQATVVQDNTGQLYIFTKEAFENKSVKTPKEYLLTGKTSTRAPFNLTATEKNKAQFPEKRVAMLIGNSNYASRADFLTTAISDIQMISRKLTELGFDIYTVYDATSSDQFRAVSKFSEIASGYDIALFYYAGHGFCYNHENYYQPIDVSQIDVASVHDCLKASELKNELSDKASKGSIIVLDACKSIAKVRGGEELAPVEAPSGMMIICSTSDGKAAADAIGNYSPFAAAFAENISKEGLSISEVARNIRNDVSNSTSQVQRPSCSDNLYIDFVFCPKKNTSNSQTNSNFENSHEFVDLGLSVKWATCNIGASNPEDYGEYYMWGETIPRRVNFNGLTNKFYLEGSHNKDAKYSKYITTPEYGPVDNKSTLELFDDAAHCKWGENWRMPTKDEFDELIGFCTWTTMTINGKQGFKVTSKINGNSIS